MEISTREKGERVRSICAYCKRSLNHIARNDEDVTAGEDNDSVSHGICPDCFLYYFPKEYLAIQEGKKIRIRKLFNKQFSDI